MSLEALAAAQRRVAERVIEEESARRRHLVVYLSGAHAYGFPSPDSDLDLKAIHIEPSSSLLGLAPPSLHADRLEVLDGVEVDYTSNELGPVLGGILAGNGNYLERVLGTATLARGPELDALRALVPDFLSRRFYRHYAGFARNQLDRARDHEPTTAKAILYVLRTALTGAHLLSTAELVADLGELASPYGFDAAHSLIATKRNGERTTLEAEERQHWIGEAERALALLESSREASSLPEEPDALNRLEAWLLDVRRSLW